MSCANSFTTEANTGVANISVANPNLDGTGAVVTVIRGNSDGTKINSIIVKAIASTSMGMVRLFINDGTKTYLFAEIPIPASLPTGVVPAFATNINGGFHLPSGYSLLASTQVANSFIVIANGTDWTNCPC